MGEAVIFSGPTVGRRRPDPIREWDVASLFEELMARLRPVITGGASLRAADIDLIERTRTAIANTSRTVRDLEARLGALQRLAVTDELTGVLNRRGFALELEKALARARRYGDEGALIYVDIDAFKTVNDSFGHGAGDAVLRAVAALLSASIRCTDHVGRLGGDEFAVLLSRASLAGSRKRAAHLSRRLQRLEVPWEDRTITVSASVGVQFYGPTHALDLAQMLEAADRAMYAEKAWRHGRPAARRFAIAS